MDVASVHPSSMASGDLASARAVVSDEFARRGRLLVGLAMRLGLSVDDATDLVQEAHLRLWRELRAGADIRDPDAWITRVVYRLAMDEHRLRRRVRTLVGRLTRPATPDPDPASALDGLALWQAVDRLPPHERAAIYFRYQMDLPFEAIATILGVTPGAARTSVSRGLARLRLIEGGPSDD